MKINIFPRLSLQGELFFPFSPETRHLREACRYINVLDTPVPNFRNTRKSMIFCELFFQDKYLSYIAYRLSLMRRFGETGQNGQLYISIYIHICTAIIFTLRNPCHVLKFFMILQIYFYFMSIKNCYQRNEKIICVDISACTYIGM